MSKVLTKINEFPSYGWCNSTIIYNLLDNGEVTATYLYDKGPYTRIANLDILKDYCSKNNIKLLSGDELGRMTESEIELLTKLNFTRRIQIAFS